MNLIRLHIRRLPGIRPGFELDQLREGTNFITGPNASGKSSLIRALGYLLHGERPGDPVGLSLSAEFVDGNTHWTVHREGSQITWERDGRTTNTPPLPAADAVASHLIAVEDLVRLEGSNEHKLAEALRRELHGGFDLQALRSGEFQIQRQVGHVQRNTLQAARQRLSKVEADQRTIHEDENQLPELKEQIEHAEAARVEAGRLNSALELTQAMRDHRAVLHRLEDFPQDMDRLGGHELDQLAQHEQRIEELNSRHREEEQQLDTARRQLEESGLEEARPAASDLELAAERIGNLARLEERLDNQAEEITQAEVACTNARSRLGGDAESAASVRPIDEEAIDRANQLARQWHGARRKQVEMQRLLEERAEQPEKQADPDRLRRSTNLLRDWLATPAAAQSAPSWRIPVIMAAIGAIGALVAGVLNLGWLALAGGALVLVATALPFLQRSSAPGAAATDSIRESYLALGLPEPEAWKRADVRVLLAQLDDELAQAQFAEERERQAGEWRRQLKDAETELETLEAEREALAEQIGFDPALLREREDFLARVRDWQLAKDALEKARKLHAETERKADALRSQITGFLRPWPGIEIDSSNQRDELQRSFNDLRERAGKADAALRAIQTGETALSRIKEDLASAQKRRDDVYRQAGLKNDQRRELEDRLQQLPEWRELKGELREAGALVTDRKKRLEQRPDLIKLAEGGQLEEIEQQLQEAEQRAGKLDSRKTDRDKIRERIRIAEGRHDREAALAETTAAHNAFEQVRDTVLQAETAHFLLDDIEREYRTESQPPLLETAQDYFARFTHHQWQLDLDDDHKHAFRALDTTLNAWRSPSELSTATRMQLLLALRLAHIEHQEMAADDAAARLTLPLFIDEALTNSDHERARVMLENLEQLASDGRQIIYLAAGLWEYQLWKNATGREPQLIDLAKVRALPAGDEHPAFELPRQPKIPAPDNRSAGEYARILEIPTFDPAAGAEAVHVFHLLHDQLELLHHLMSDWRIKTTGQLRSLLESRAGATAVPDAKLRRSLLGRCSILEEWIAAWQTGRGKPVDRSVLEEARDRGILSETTFDGVAAGVADANQDAHRLVELLEEPIPMKGGAPRRLNINKRKELRDFLIEFEHLDERERLTADQRRQQVLERMAAHAPARDIQVLVDVLEENHRDWDELEEVHDAGQN